MKNLKKNSGVTVVELLLVLIVIGTILIVSLEGYYYYLRQRDMLTLKQSVVLAMNAFNAYYLENCHNDGFLPTAGSSTISFSSLAINTPNQILNPYNTPSDGASSFVFNINVSGTAPALFYVLEMQVTMNQVNSAELPGYQAALGASDHTDTSIVWRMLPGNQVPGITQNFWLLQTDLQVFTNETSKATTPACPL